MFDHAGRKIKYVAQVVHCLGTVGSSVAGLSIIVTDFDMVLAGIAVIVLGSIAAWVSALMVYGFGQLIENTDKMVLANGNIPETAPQEPVAKNTEPAVKATQLTPNFTATIRQTPTEDLKLILLDQQDLYSPEEIAFIRQILKTRLEQ